MSEHFISFRNKVDDVIGEMTIFVFKSVSNFEEVDKIIVSDETGNSRTHNVGFIKTFLPFLKGVIKI